jgi:hypothetical protein
MQIKTYTHRKSCRTLHIQIKQTNTFYNYTYLEKNNSKHIHAT